MYIIISVQAEKSGETVLSGFHIYRQLRAGLTAIQITNSERVTQSIGFGLVESPFRIPSPAARRILGTAYDGYRLDHPLLLTGSH